MDDDDPEKRIRELERSLADLQRHRPSPQPYTGDVPPPAVDAPYTANPYAANSPYASDAPPPAVDAPYTANPYGANQPYASDAPPPAIDAPYTANPYGANQPYAGNTPYVRDPTWGVNFRPPRRRARPPWIFVVIALAIFMPTIGSLVAHFASSTRSNFGNGSGATASNGPTTVPQGGELRVGGTNEGRTVECNNGKLTLYGTNTDYYVTGHCVSLTVGGYHNTVKVPSADTLESTGYSNTVTVQDCNNGNLTLSSYDITFDVTGSCASLTISSYDNKVTVGSVDTINIGALGYNNVVTYHSGKPQITDSGHSNNIQQG